MDFWNVIFVKNQFLKCDLKKVNFANNAIWKMWISWIMWLFTCDFLDEMWIFAPVWKARSSLLHLHFFILSAFKMPKDVSIPFCYSFSNYHILPLLSLKCLKLQFFGAWNTQLSVWRGKFHNDQKFLKSLILTWNIQLSCEFQTLWG